MPGVSTSSRRRSGWDGFASSSSWNDGEDPEHGPDHREAAHGRDGRATGGDGRRAQELQQAQGVLVAQQRERDDDEGVDHEHGEPGLEEHGQPLPLPDGHDARDPAEQDVGAELEARAVHGRGEHGDQRGHDHRDARIEQDGDQHPDGGQRQRIRQPRPARGELEREHGEQQQQAQQQQHVVAMPELAPEAPGPGQQQADHEHRQHDEAAEARDVEAALVQPVVGDRLEREVVYAVAAADDGLALLPALQHRRDVLGGLGLLLGGEIGRERRVGGDERGDEGRGERALVGVQVARHAARDGLTDRGDLAVAELGPLDGLEHARRLGADRRPALLVEARERRPVVRAESRERRLEDEVAVGGLHALGERGLDRGDLRVELAQLLGRDRGGTGRGEVVLRRDRRARGVALLLGEDVADVLVGARGLHERRVRAGPPRAAAAPAGSRARGSPTSRR